MSTVPLFCRDSYNPIGLASRSDGIARCKCFHPKRYANIELAKTYEINEKEKKKTYNERILQVEHRSSRPLVMSATGGMSRECKKFYSGLAEIICKKRKTNYNVTITWIQEKLHFRK